MHDKAFDGKNQYEAYAAEEVKAVAADAAAAASRMNQQTETGGKESRARGQGKQKRKREVTKGPAKSVAHSKEQMQEKSKDEKETKRTAAQGVLTRARAALMAQLDANKDVRKAGKHK